MYRSLIASKTFVLFVITGLVLAPLQAAAERNAVVGSANRAAPNRDVTLTPSGDLQGTITNFVGQPEAKVPVEIRHQGQVVSLAVTDARGNFVARGLSAGSYDLQTAAGKKQIRLWHASTAPPHAASNLEINDYEVVRGQYLGAMHPHHIPPCAGQGHQRGPFEGAFKGGTPWLFGLGVAAAIALPIALSDSNDGTRIDDFGGDKGGAS